MCRGETFRPEGGGFFESKHTNTMKLRKLLVFALLLLGMQLSVQALNCLEQPDGCLVCLERAQADDYGACYGTNGNCIIIEVTCPAAQ